MQHTRGLATGKSIGLASNLAYKGEWKPHADIIKPLIELIFH